MSDGNGIHSLHDTFDVRPGAELENRVFQVYIRGSSCAIVRYRQCVLTNNLGSTCVLIGLQMRFQSAMNHENDVSNMVGCLEVVRIYRQFYERNLSIHTRFIYRLSLC